MDSSFLFCNNIQLLILQISFYFPLQNEALLTPNSTKTLNYKIIFCRLILFVRSPDRCTNLQPECFHHVRKFIDNLIFWELQGILNCRLLVNQVQGLEVYLFHDSSCVELGRTPLWLR